MQFGAQLKDWRRRRGVSQLQLGLEAGVSSRHIAFIETGRSQPTRAMVLRLSQALEVPRSQRNLLLEAAGFAALYRSRQLSDVEMTPIRMAVDWTLQRHEPYPAIALDRHWMIVALNDAAAGLVAPVGLSAGDSLLDAFLEPSGLRSAIENWHEVAGHLYARLVTESRHLGGDPILDGAARTLSAELGDRSVQPGVLPAVVPTRLRVGPAILALVSTIAQFGTAEDIALADLRIELMFPADEDSRLILEGLAAARRSQ